MFHVCKSLSLTQIYQVMECSQTVTVLRGSSSPYWWTHTPSSACDSLNPFSGHYLTCHFPSKYFIHCKKISESIFLSFQAKRKTQWRKWRYQYSRACSSSDFKSQKFMKLCSLFCLVQRWSQMTVLKKPVQLIHKQQRCAILFYYFNYQIKNKDYIFLFPLNFMTLVIVIPHRSSSLTVSLVWVFRSS